MQMTFDQANAHVESLKNKPKSPIKTGDTASEIVAAYVAVKPLLQYIVGIPFMPSSWGSLITGFMATCDKFVPA